MPVAALLLLGGLHGFSRRHHSILVSRYKPDFKASVLVTLVNTSHR